MNPISNGPIIAATPSTLWKQVCEKALCLFQRREFSSNEYSMVKKFETLQKRLVDAKNHSLGCFAEWPIKTGLLNSGATK